MGVTIVVGGQFGSEGKGKTVALEAQRYTAPYVVRCGGPNSGHTIPWGSDYLVLRQVPSGVVNPNAMLMLGPGTAVDVDVLLEEVRTLGLDRERLVVDPRAVLVRSADRALEAELMRTISSTGSGAGGALVKRMLRATNDLAEHSEPLRAFARVEPVTRQVQRHIDRGGDVIVEGTQGFGLSLLHGEYPYVTVRDTTASAFASEAGIAPRQVTRVLVVFRTFPIRVGGNSGPLNGELTWDQVRDIGGAPQTFPEFTSVTKRLRRVGKFDWDLAARSVETNRPTGIALMGLDRIDYAVSNQLARDLVSENVQDFVASVEARLGCPVEIAGTGFGNQAIRWQP
jgi:adenylosuccinate synthase